MVIKIFYFILLYSVFAVFVYLVTHFTLKQSFEQLVLIIEIPIVILFSIFLWVNIKNKKIKYKLNSASALIGYVGVIVIFFGLMHFSLVYPTSFLLHKLIEQPFKENFAVIDKNISAYQFLCAFKIELKNEGLSTKACVPQLVYKKIDLNDLALVTGHKSFFGSTVDNITIDHKTNKTEEPIKNPQATF